MFVSLLALLPVLAWWALSAGHPVTRGLAAGVLMFGSVTAWLNLVPLFQLDGYHMLAHALRAGGLRTETVHYAGLVLRRNPRRLAYGRTDRWIYSVYGAVSAVVLAGGYLTLRGLVLLPGPLGRSGGRPFGAGVRDAADRRLPGYARRRLSSAGR